jgi:hypothetical protein
MISPHELALQPGLALAVAGFSGLAGVAAAFGAWGAYREGSRSRLIAMAAVLIVNAGVIGLSLYNYHHLSEQAAADEYCAKPHPNMVVRG